ncbi:protein containing DUF901 [Candidatus Omnitrophus magneticus]|uniref:Protein containing DUF901 n=1 Tax=Candidatus Omnitrophus magneticus TaxID=1609969 RepID=A0A0F0CRW5_9BACT|nr:protein containing DUF901 [Candidatus Omnitrophus magneticus]
MTILVIDGYNAIYAIPEIKEKLNKSLLEARETILEYAQNYVRHNGLIDRAIVVFDGKDEHHSPISKHLGGKIQIFSNTGKGDDKVIETAKILSKHSKIIVASNDNYVRNNSKVYGAGIMDVRDLVKINPNKKTKKSKK